MTVRASFDDGTSKELALYDAKISDRINVSVASKTGDQRLFGS